MAQQQIANGESGLDVRNALNSMFTELYGAIGPFQPIVINGMSANYNQPIVAGTFVTYILIKPVSGSITLNIGTSPNGGEILPNTEVSSYIPIQMQQLFETASTLYFTLTGTGSLNVYIFYLSNIL